MELIELARKVRDPRWNRPRDAFIFACPCGKTALARMTDGQLSVECSGGCRSEDIIRAASDPPTNQPTNRTPEADEPGTGQRSNQIRTALTANRAEILRAFKLIAQPSGVHEVRALQTEGLGPTASGYFNSAQPLVEAAANVIAEGVYVTLNPVNPALLARVKNALKRFARHTTSDTDIISRRWMPIDLDAVRPSGISSTDAEHQAALERTKRVRAFLTERGWPAPILADSGNGGHLLYRIAEPNDADTAALMRRVLEALDSEFSDETVAVDRTTYNAARIWKLYGTIARKGDSTADRPHRLARIIEAPDEPGIVTREQFEQLAALLPEPEPQANTYQRREQFDLEGFIARHGIPTKRRSTWSGGERWVLERCVFDPNHTGSSAAILRMASGAIVYRCLHNGCAGRAWRDVRELFEPGYRNRRRADSNDARDDASEDWMESDNPWTAAQQVDEFLAAVDAIANWLVENILARESVTVFSSPRGLGKTHLAYWLAIRLALTGFRVLIIDRDNPKAEIKRRLKAWGATGLGDKLKVITREKAPPLTDRSAWAAFPYDQYDCVILDSITAATEGVEEKDGGKAGAGIAPLLDAARHGPAVLVLANTDKAGLKIRGSGILSDRADIVFEVRDGTDLNLEARHVVWWDALPEAGEQAWAERAKRRRRRSRYRLALVVSKFRVGEEPTARIFEVCHDTEPWNVAEVTDEVEKELEEAKRKAADAAQLKIDLAVKALKAALPLPKNPDTENPEARNASALLMEDPHGFSRNAARRLIEDRMGRDWIQTGSGTKGDLYILRAPAGNEASQSPYGTGASEKPIPAATGAEGRPESTFRNDSPPRRPVTTNSGRQFPFKADTEPARTCPQCGQEVRGPNGWVAHEMRRDGRFVVVCPQCGRDLAARSATADASGGVPFMITREMKARLRELGRTDDEIARMTPAEAHSILNGEDF